MNAALLALALMGPVQAKPAALKLPAGFTATEFAGNDLAPDIQIITLDPTGRIVVAGRGYVRVLVDENGDGRAEKTHEVLAEANLAPMGLLWEPGRLFVVGAKGLWSYPLGPNDKSNGSPTRIRSMKAEGEHDAHAVKRGPDGRLYLLCGNMAGVDEKWCGPGSPVKSPVAGCLVRFSKDMQSTQVIADGFRNAYDFDFNLDGEPFTYDSDNERCIGLPWYEGCRFYHVMAGAHHGWQSPQRGEFWRMPPYYFDVSKPLADLGRGSPTGVVCYRHTAFPEKYRGGFFLLDWTFGKIHFASLRTQGSGYEADVETFASPTGDEGFAPVGAVVHPATGDLYVAIGGRGTRGAVYRIRHAEAGAKESARPLPIRAVNFVDGDEIYAAATGPDLRLRRLAIEELMLNPAALDKERFTKAIADLWSHPDRTLRQTLARTLQGRPEEWKSSPSARRIEPASRQGGGVRYGAVEIARAREMVVRGFSRAPEERDGESPALILGEILRALQEERSSAMEPGVGNSRREIALDLVRLLEKTALRTPAAARGTIFEAALELRADRQIASGYAFMSLPRATAPLAREINRIALAVAIPPKNADARIKNQFLPRMTAIMLGAMNSSSDPAEDVHLLMSLTYSPLTPFSALPIARALVNLEYKYDRPDRPRDRNWYARIRELHAALAKMLPELNEAILAEPKFGRPEHALFALAPSFAPLRPKAAARILATLEKDSERKWTPDAVELLASLPPETILPKLRARWDDRGLRDEIVAALAKSPDPVDRERFLESLAAPQLATVDVALGALEKLTAKPGATWSAAALRQVLTAHDQAPPEKLGAKIRGRCLSLLVQMEGPGGTPRDRAAWGAWLAAKHPAEAKKLAGEGSPWPAFEPRLARIRWEDGSAERGKSLFQKSACANCHSGNRALGPDLRGVAGRFSRADLFRSIVDPHRDVADRYRTSLVASTGGKLYQGAIVYEAPDGVILQTGADQTVRIPGAEIAERRVQRTSLMPTGLLDKFSDAEVADLDAFLKTLK
ncbi:MAG TPA: c-type cytochrome [Planctomycetia bacterium]|nr:c-type cytochrome [Planctomycetia bacterium]